MDVGGCAITDSLLLVRRRPRAPFGEMLLIDSVHAKRIPEQLPWNGALAFKVRVRL